MPSGCAIPPGPASQMTEGTERLVEMAPPSTGKQMMLGLMKMTFPKMHTVRTPYATKSSG